MRVYQQEAVSVTLKLTAMDCPDCGVVFAISAELDHRRRSDGQRFYCPNGHGMSYGEGEAEKARKAATAEAARLRKSLEANEQWLKEESERRQAAERSLAATRGQVTKLRKRLGNGICPYCVRHFTALERHIRTKHPDQPFPMEVPATTEVP